MKRLKLFMGAACLVLAVGSAFATKAVMDPNNDYVHQYYDAVNEIEYGPCLPVPITNCTGASDLCYKSGFTLPVVGTVSRFVYDDPACEDILQELP